MSSASVQPPLHVRTPLNYSPVLSARAGCNVYLKLDNAQPSGSFKNRGVGLLAQRSLETHGSRTHLFISSGGNAGLACAYAAWSLGVRCTVCVPQPTRATIVARLRGFGCEVVQGGAHWAEADKEAKRLVAMTDGGVYVPPFDHPTVVEGHASLVFELKDQLKEQGVEDLAGVICSVGGGGLLAGILRGMDEADLQVPVLACETRGAASLALSLKHARASPSPSAELQSLSGITSIASSLGAVQVSQECLNRVLAHEEHGGVVSVVVEDERCVTAIRSFTDDHSFLVEPACSASLTPIYLPSALRAALPSTSFLPAGTAPPKSAPAIVVIVCGGNTLDLATFEKWETDFKGRPEGDVVIGHASGDTVV